VPDLAVLDALALPVKSVGEVWFPTSNEIETETKASAETPKAGLTKESFRREFDSTQFQSRAA